MNLGVDFTLLLFAPLDFGNALFQAPAPLFTRIPGSTLSGETLGTVGNLPLNVLVHCSKFVSSSIELARQCLGLCVSAFQILQDRLALFFQRLLRRGCLSNLRV
jgi:hypothetical protein